MATEVTLPELGESVTEGTITAWLVSEGDTVEADQPIFELSSDKIDTEVPSPAAGTITEIRVGVDETVEVGTVVAVIGGDGEATGEGGGRQESETDEAPDAPAEEESQDAEEGGGEGAAPQEEREAVAQDDEAPADDTGEPTDDKERVKGQTSDQGTEVVLPELGESVTEGTITAWLVSEGDTVEVDQPIFELSSDKIDTEVPSPAAGTITEIRVGVDETVDVGTVVAVIGGGDAAPAGEKQEPAEQPAGERQAAGQPAEDEQEPAEEPSTQPEPSGDGAGAEVLASPLVRRMINERGLDAGQISGSGKGGRITREDVEAASGSQQPAEREQRQQPAAKQEPEREPAEPKQPAAAGTVEPGDRERMEDLSRIRQRIAARMMESMQSSAQLTTVQEADVSQIMAVRATHKDQFKAREKVSLSPFAFLCRAAVLALKRHEKLNARAEWDAGKVIFHDYVNLGLAVDTERGLLVPNIKNADDLTLPALARAIAEAATKARGKGLLEMSDIQGGTFTVTNTGSVGVLIDTPILNYPEVAILGTGAIRKRPVVVEDEVGPAIAIRDMMYLSLTYDHRLIDGADAARYVTDVKQVVETHDWAGELGY